MQRLLIAATILLSFCGRAAAAPAEAEAGLVTASGRQVFWRGEQVGLSLTVALSEPTEAVVTLAPAGETGVAIYRGKLNPVEGVARLHLLLPGWAPPGCCSP